MGTLTRGLRKARSRLTTSGLSSPSKWLLHWAGGMTSAAGVDVYEDRALTVSAWYRGVNAIAMALASSPLIVYERLGDRGKKRAPEHPLYELLHDQPNPEMTSYTWRLIAQGHVLTWGNHYSEIERTGAGAVRALWPLRPDQMRIERRDGQLWYIYQPPKGAPEVLLRPDQVFHVPGLGFDGLRGYSPIALARESLGLSLAMEEYAATLFGNGVHPGGIIEYPKRLGEEAKEKYRKAMQEAYGGLGKAHRLMVLEEGVSYTQVGIPPDDAQFLEGRQHQLGEIARWLNIPPHKLYDLSRATYSNIEHQAIEFGQDTMRPWMVHWEQTIRWKLLSAAERKRYFAEFVMDGILRADAKSRAEANQIRFMNGALPLNEWLGSENLNPVEGGDRVFVPANLIPLDRLDEWLDARNPQPSLERSAEARDRHFTTPTAPELRELSDEWQGTRELFAPLIADAELRIVTRERADVLRAAEKYLRSQARTLADFEDWLQEFYYTHPKYIIRQVAPTMEQLARKVNRDATVMLGIGETADFEEIREFVRAYVEMFAEGHARDSLGQLRYIIQQAILEGDDPTESLEQRLGEWMERRPDKVAREHSVRLQAAVAIATWRLRGVSRLRWQTIGDSCPYCRQLNGKVVGIDDWFAAKGDSLQDPDNPDNWMSFSHDVGHPPAHSGCDCIVTPS